MSVHTSLAEDRGGITSLWDVSTASSVFLHPMLSGSRSRTRDFRIEFSFAYQLELDAPKLNVQNISRLLLFSVTCEILTGETVNITISWNATPCSLKIMFEGTYCFHLLCFPTHPPPSTLENGAGNFLRILLCIYQTTWLHITEDDYLIVMWHICLKQALWSPRNSRC